MQHPYTDAVDCKSVTLNVGTFTHSLNIRRHIAFVNITDCIFLVSSAEIDD